MDLGRLRPVAKIAVFDIAGPLLTYNLLRSAGLGLVTALVLSGVFPAAGVIIGFSRHRRVDAVGVLVLSGIAVGAVLGLVSHNAKLVLDEASVGTAVFGLLCFGSLGTPEPLMYRLTREFTGPDTPRGRELTSLWRHDEFRHLFRIITAVWGTGFAAEAAARIVIVQNTSAGTALAVSNVLPFAVAGLLCAWTVGYGQYHKRKGERLAAAAGARPALSAAPDLPAETTAALTVAHPADPGEGRE
jgi:hypothetical protein